MKFQLPHRLLFLVLIISLFTGLSSCTKKDELFAAKGTVVNTSNSRVTNARVEIFENVSFPSGTLVNI